MSAQAQNTTTKSKFTLTQKVMAFFKITEDAKVDSFFIGLEKEWNREIKTRQHNIQTVEFEYEEKLSKLQDQLVDAEQALEDAWVNVNPDKLVTKSAEKDYAVQYVAHIENAEAEVMNLNNSIEYLQQNHAEILHLFNDEILTLQARLAKLNSL
jgi:vacuolar-type H+-ATPase subunit I/STV1